MFDFVKEEEVKKLKKEAFSLKTAINKRLKKVEKPKRYRWISASKAYDYDVYDFVKSYFLGHVEEKCDLDCIFFKEIGTLIHKILQNEMSLCGGVVDCEKSFCHRKHGFVGSIDGLIQSDFVIPKNRKVPNQTMHWEIKTVTEYAYKQIAFVSDISLKYRMQAEIYQNMLGVDKTLFSFVDRHSYSSKCLVYEGKGELYYEACSKAKSIWECIGSRELPHYNEMSKMEWQDLIKDVVVPLSPAELEVDDATDIY